MNVKINENLVQKYFEDAIKDLQEVIKIPSFASQPALNAPYGVATREVLEKTISICSKLGFKTFKDSENRYGYAEYGDGEKLFGIICHLDVVPSGDESKWTFPPFSGQIANDYLYGRGSVDDKGPTILNIYAIKYWMDQNWKPKNYRIRLIFGLTEETTWESIAHYIKNEELPDLGYTPDGEWPLIYAEKRILRFDLITRENTSLIVNGGKAYNIVCDDVTIEDPTNNIKKTYSGLAAHGSTPEKGDNAIFKLVKEHPNYDLTVFKLIRSLWEKDFDLKPIFQGFKDESGAFSGNLGIIEVKDGYQRIGFDLRCPVTLSLEEIENKINSFIKSFDPNIEFKLYKHTKPIFLKQDTEYIQKLLKVYREVTGEKEAKPLAIGGGTYARAFDNVVAFGAAWDMDAMHTVDEKVSLADLKKTFLIYIRSMIEIID
ncbi:MAG: M20 family metallopeptidase [Mycoplasma sp.]|nr:M20 family metallopeptidase [Mycoplasma sp.]